MDDQINKGVVSGASISRRKDIYIGLGYEKFEEKKSLEDRVVDGRIILK
jgi:hypothetical protein